MYEKGVIVEGKVGETEDYFVNITLEDGKIGIIDKRFASGLQKGQKVQAKVLNFNPNNGKLFLSLNTQDTASRVTNTKRAEPLGIGELEFWYPKGKVRLPKSVERCFDKPCGLEEKACVLCDRDTREGCASNYGKAIENMVKELLKHLELEIKSNAVENEEIIKNKYEQYNDYCEVMKLLTNIRQVRNAFTHKKTKEDIYNIDNYVKGMITRIRKVMGYDYIEKNDSFSFTDISEEQLNEIIRIDKLIIHRDNVNGLKEIKDFFNKEFGVKSENLIHDMDSLPKDIRCGLFILVILEDEMDCPIAATSFALLCDCFGAEQGDFAKLYNSENPNYSQLEKLINVSFENGCTVIKLKEGVSPKLKDYYRAKQDLIKEKLKIDYSSETDLITLQGAALSALRGIYAKQKDRFDLTNSIEPDKNAKKALDQAVSRYFYAVVKNGYNTDANVRENFLFVEEMMEYGNTDCRYLQTLPVLLNNKSDKYIEWLNKIAEFYRNRTIMGGTHNELWKVLTNDVELNEKTLFELISNGCFGKSVWEAYLRPRNRLKNIRFYAGVRDVISKHIKTEDNEVYKNLSHLLISLEQPYLNNIWGGNSGNDMVVEFQKKLGRRFWKKASNLVQSEQLNKLRNICSGKPKENIDELRNEGTPKLCDAFIADFKEDNPEFDADKHKKYLRISTKDVNSRLHQDIKAFCMYKKLLEYYEKILTDPARNDDIELNEMQLRGFIENRTMCGEKYERLGFWFNTLKALEGKLENNAIIGVYTELGGIYGILNQILVNKEHFCFKSFNNKFQLWTYQLPKVVKSDSELEIERERSRDFFCKLLTEQSDKFSLESCKRLSDLLKKILTNLFSIHKKVMVEDVYRRYPEKFAAHLLDPKYFMKLNEDLQIKLFHYAKPRWDPGKKDRNKTEFQTEFETLLNYILEDEANWDNLTESLKSLVALQYGIKYGVNGTEYPLVKSKLLVMTGKMSLQRGSAKVDYKKYGYSNENDFLYHLTEIYKDTPYYVAPICMLALPSAVYNMSRGNPIGFYRIALLNPCIREFAFIYANKLLECYKDNTGNLIGFEELYYDFIQNTVSPIVNEGKYAPWFNKCYKFQVQEVEPVEVDLDSIKDAYFEKYKVDIIDGQRIDEYKHELNNSKGEWPENWVLTLLEEKKNGKTEYQLIDGAIKYYAWEGFGSAYITKPKIGKAYVCHITINPEPEDNTLPPVETAGKVETAETFENIRDYDFDEKIRKALIGIFSRNNLRDKVLSEEKPSITALASKLSRAKCIDEKCVGEISSYIYDYNNRTTDKTVLLAEKIYNWNNLVAKLEKS